jgi:hypothetical protein
MKVSAVKIEELNSQMQKAVICGLMSNLVFKKYILLPIQELTEINIKNNTLSRGIANPGNIKKSPYTVEDICSLNQTMKV